MNRKIGVVLQHKVVTVIKMTEVPLQLVILTLPIYALLTLLIVTRPKRSLNLPHTHWGKPHPKSKTKRRKQHIIRLGPGNFTIQEEEKRPRGKPRGAKGGGRHKPQKVDQIREAHPNHCNHCGAKIPQARKPRKTNQRTVVDLEKTEGSITKKVTLWKVHQVRCPACGKLASGENQVNAQKGHTYGYGVQTYVLYQHLELGFLPPDIAKNLKFLLGPDTPSIQTIRNWITQAAQKNKPLIQELLKRAKREKHLQVDETGLPMDGKKNWVWVIATETTTIYLARETRGHKAIEKELQDYNGTLIVDFWKAYDELPQRKQRCLTHLFRRISDNLIKQVKTLNRLIEELKKIEEQRRSEKAGKQGRRRGRPPKTEALNAEQETQHKQRIAELRITTEAFYQLLALIKEAMKRKIGAEQAKKRLLSILEEGKSAESLSEDYRRISKLVRAHIDELFLFLEELELPHSTNGVEGEIKPYASVRGKSPCRRSLESAQAYTDLLSYSATWKKVGLDPYSLYPLLVRGMWRTVHQLIEGSPGKPPPATSTKKVWEVEVA